MRNARTAEPDPAGTLNDGGMGVLRDAKVRTDFDDADSNEVFRCVEDFLKKVQVVGRKSMH